jgi:hypothetical protein
MPALVSTQTPFSATVEETHLPGVDPVFVLARWRGLCPPPLVSPSRFEDHLAHLIARSPGDLKAHTRRILYYIQGMNGEGAYGALLDLFLVLGSRGVELRQRLFNRARNYLTSDQHTLFVTHYQRGIARSESLPASSYSVLGNFFSGTIKLVISADKTDSPGCLGIRDPLVQARELISYRQHDQAQRLLENMLLASPLREDVNEELLNIYLRTGNGEAFLNMVECLNGRRTALPEVWKETAEQLNVGGDE